MTDWLEKFETDDDRTPSNEKILNTIRRKGPRNVGTMDIVERVPIKYDAVMGRLNQLEQEGRVYATKVGSEDDFTYIWHISEGERKTPVNPKIAKLAYWCEEVKTIGQNALLSAKYIGLGGVVLVILTLTAIVEGISLGAPPAILLYLGWAIALGSAGAGVGGALLILIGIGTENLGEWLVESNDNDQDESDEGERAKEIQT